MFRVRYACVLALFSTACSFGADSFRFQSDLGAGGGPSVAADSSTADSSTADSSTQDSSTPPESGSDSSALPEGSAPDVSVPADSGSDAADAAPEASSPFKVVVAPSASVVAGKSANLDVSVTADAGFSAAITITVTDLPAGVTATTLKLSPGQAGQIAIAADATAGAGTFTAHVSSTSGALGSAPIALTLTVIGAPGSLDTTFGTGGRVTLTLASPMTVGAVTTDGDENILVGVGASDSPTSKNAIIYRYLPNGTQDQQFGAGGQLAMLDVSSVFAGAMTYNPTITALLVQPDGKIIVGGHLESYNSTHMPYYGHFTARLQKNGAAWAYDTTWNATGLNAAGGTSTSFISWKMQSFFWTKAGAVPRVEAQIMGDRVRRCTAAGVDETWGVTGKPGWTFAAAALDSSENMIVTGKVSSSTPPYPAVVFRFLATGGTMDASYGALSFDGTYTAATNPCFTGDAAITVTPASVAVDAQGNAILTTDLLYTSGNPPYTHVCISRVTATGAADGTFGAGLSGPARGALPHVVIAGINDMHAGRVRIDANGNIVALGVVGPVAGGTQIPRVMIVRRLSGGSPDPTIGPGGTALADIGAQAGDVLSPLDLFIGKDGHLTALVLNKTAGALVMARFWP